MQLLKLDLAAADVPTSDPPVGGAPPLQYAEPQPEQVQHLHHLWPPAAIAHRMAGREREIERLLREMRDSIGELRRDREVLIGQLRDLTRLANWPVVEAEGAAEGAADGAAPAKRRRRVRTSERSQRRGSKAPKTRRRRNAAEPPEVAPRAAALAAAPPSDPEPGLNPAALPEVAATAVEPGAGELEAFGREHPDECRPSLADAAPPPRTPEDEFEALVHRLRTPIADDEQAPPSAVEPRTGGPARVAAVAAIAAVIVLATPTVGQIQPDLEPERLPSHARFLGVTEAPQLRDGREATGLSMPMVPTLRLEVTTLRPAWIRAVIDDGWEVEQVVDGGVTVPLDGQTAISLILRDAGAVRLRVNGEDQGLAGDDGEAVALQFESSRAVATDTSSPPTAPE